MVPIRRLRRRRSIAVLVTAAVVVFVVAGYAAYTTLQHVAPYLIGPGCQAGTGRNSVSLDTQQASIAATIAGVAARQGLPQRAVVIAYATAMQESHMHNLHYGDRDSVGVFQQRPSQGWGTTSELENPIYATTKFFDALVQVPGYQQMPVDQAAQAVQHSADGAAYGRHDLTATAMATAFTGSAPHDVWCWGTASHRTSVAVTAAVHALDTTFGTAGPDGPAVQLTTVRGAGSAAAALRVPAATGWTVAAWLVTHARTYGINDVSYDGYRWRAAAGSKGWQRDTAAPTDSILLG